MKRILFVLLAFSLFLSACGGAPAVQNTTETAGNTAVETAVTEPADTFQYPQFAHVPTEEDLNKIPVARSSMTEDEVRQIVVDAMHFQVNLAWTPSHKVSYSYPSAGAADASGMLHFFKGVRYGGLPYTQAASDVMPLLDRLDPETGILNTERINMMDTLGNNCATAVYWAWARVSTTQKGYGTQNLCPTNNVIILGNLATSLGASDNYQVQSTKDIIAQNGDQAVFRAYASMKKADGFVGFVNGGQHHAMLLCEDPVVVKNADGTINGAQSYVIVSEEYSGNSTHVTENGQITRIGGLDNKYSFSTLIKKFYLPISVAELQDVSKIEEPRILLEVSEKTTLAELGEAKVTSNYAISRVITRFIDQNGKTVYESRRYGAANSKSKEVALFLSAASANAVRRSIGVGNFTVEVTVRLGNGESFTAYKGVCGIA